ncbi:MAG: adenosylcobinamide-phosphate synthase CbiB [Eubacteriales bacterium]|nr:adenosylcobinamide-phosphate synthase CbiB [Eubacteriales bacterium]
MRLSLLALLIGFLIDLILGDPRWLYHPIRLVGNLISLLEGILRRIFGIPAGEGKSPKKEFAAGVILAVLVILVSAGVPLILLVLAQWVHPYLRLVLESIWCWQLLAARSLRDESMKVFDRLKDDDLEGSRHAVSMIVGRDTQRLDKTGVAKAAVETVAENASDGVIAPMFYMMIGGAVLGFFYKAINTMDSMVGYKNDRYLYFGRFAAKLDDAANFVPARLCALFMIAASFLCRMDGKNAWKIFKRDRFNHASPNSAQTEAVMAGALEIQLAGDAWYFGELHKKKTIGDNIRPVEPEDIVRANELLYGTAALAVTVMSAVKWIILLIV